ncbi:MAG: hypothetical protein ACRECP_08595 [Methylocella sp.]
MSHAPGLSTPGLVFEASAAISLLARYAGMVIAGYVEPAAGQDGVLRVGPAGRLPAQIGITWRDIRASRA